MENIKLYNTSLGIVVHKSEEYRFVPKLSWGKLINRIGLSEFIKKEWAYWDPFNGPDLEEIMLPPIDHQEVWASGVTYLKSKQARMEESEDHGAADCYDRVYDAVRPELFFKSTASRVVGHQGKVRIRRDSSWNVPEPELSLFISSQGSIEGFSIGNDLSSRSIEGENPLYLPQAKMYNGSAALGPCLLVSNTFDRTNNISMQIIRSDNVIYNDQVSIGQMKRSFEELVEHLFREMDFPDGCFLMTGTALVPDPPFTLLAGDVININIDPIGQLTNVVADN